MSNEIHRNKIISPLSAILIIDRIGVFGERLAEQYSNDFFVILITNRTSAVKSSRITKLKFGSKTPKAPRNNYSKMLIVDDGSKSALDYVASFIKEGKKLNSEIYYLASLRNKNLNRISPILNSYEKGKVFVFGDVFDNEIYFEKDTAITKYIYGARNSGKIIVSNDGLGESFPVSLQDTVKLIIKASYVKVSQKNILLFCTTSTTDMTLAHMFQKIDPNIDVDFRNDEKKLLVYFPKDSTFAIRKYNLQKEVGKLDLSRAKYPQAIRKENKNNDYYYAKYLITFILIVVLLFFLPFITTKTYTMLGYQQISSSHEKAKNGNYEKALIKANNAVSLFEFAQKGNEIFESQLMLLDKQDLNDDLENQIIDGYLVANASANFYKSLILFESIYDKKSLNTKQDFYDGLEYLKSAYTSYLKNDLNSKKLNLSEKRIKDSLPSIEKIVAVSEVLPSVLGFDEEKTYLVLFSNNTNLRPNGGTAEAVGILSIKDSQISSFEILRVNDIDSKISNIEAPFSTRRYLGEKSYSLKNGGMNLDYVTNSIKASSAYGLAKNKEVDGVIGVDLYYIKNLLNLISEINVDGVGEVGSDNLEQIIEGSDNPDEIYVKLLNSLFKEIKEKDLGMYYLFLNPLGAMTNEGHLLFAFKDNEIQNVFTANNFPGTINESLKENSSMLSDYLGIYDSNFGKSNISHLISKSVLRESKILSSGNIESILSISYKNGSVNPDSTYNNYLQIILPLGTTIDEVSIGGLREDLIPAISDPNIFEEDDFVEPDGLEIKQSVEMGKGVYGFMVEIPPDSVKIVKVKYSLPFTVVLENKAIPYSLMLYKQPGANPYPFNMTFNSNNFNILPDKIHKTELTTNEFLRFIITEK